jgi:SAM-dependent methyltransferase
MAKRLAKYVALGLVALALVVAGLWLHNRWRYKMFHSLTATAEATDQQRNMERNREQLRGWAEQGRDPADVYKSISLLPSLEDFGIAPGDTIADIGAGTGALTIRLLSQGVDFSRLYAVDIDPLSLQFLGLMLESFSLPAENRVVVHRSRVEDVLLPEGAIDVVTIVNCRLGLRHIDKPLPPTNLEDRDRLYQSIRRALKDDGHVALIEPLREANFRTYPMEYLLEPFFKNGFCLESRRIDTKLFPQYYYFPIRYHVMRLVKKDAPNRAKDAVCNL